MSSRLCMSPCELTLSWAASVAPDRLGFPLTFAVAPQLVNIVVSSSMHKQDEVIHRGPGWDLPNTILINVFPRWCCGIGRCCPS
jgi:hypothetical protein